MARSTNFHSLPFNSARTESLESPPYKRTEGRQISIFNIIDYQVVFTNEDEKKPYLLWKKLNGINWLIFIWAVAKNIRCVGIKQKDLSILSFFIDCSKLNLFL